MCLIDRQGGRQSGKPVRSAHVTRRGKLFKCVMCFWKERWCRMVGHDILRQQRERKLWQTARGKDKEKSERGGLPERVSLGLLVPLRYYFHLPFPELSELLHSELMWAEICLSLWPSSSSGWTQGQWLAAVSLSQPITPPPQPPKFIIQ